MTIGDIIARRLERIVEKGVIASKKRWTKEAGTGAGGIGDTIKRKVPTEGTKATAMTLPTLLKLLGVINMPLWAFLHEDDAVFEAVSDQIGPGKTIDQRHALALAALTLLTIDDERENAARTRAASAAAVSESSELREKVRGARQPRRQSAAGVNPRSPRKPKSEPPASDAGP